MQPPKSVLEFIFSTCEKEGKIHPIDLAFYERFLAYTDVEIQAIVEKIIIASANELNKIIQTEGKTDADLFSYLERLLLFLSHGILAFSESGQLVFLKPSIYPPPKKFLQLIDNRIENLRPIIKLALLNTILRPGNRH